MADTTARIVLSAEDKTGAALASLRNGLSGVTNQATALQGVFTRLVPALTFAGAATFVKSINDGVDAFNDLKDATGASIENISALEDIAARTGTSFDTVGTSLIKFNQALAQADEGSNVAKALKAIGLEASELKKLDPAEALRRTAAALSGYADDAGKARLVQEIFGRSLREVAPFLNDLATQTQLVAKVTAEQAAEAEKFNKELFTLQKNATDAGRALTADLVKGLNETAKAFRDGGLVQGLQTLFTGNDEFKASKTLVQDTEKLLNLENAISQARASGAKDDGRILSNLLAQKKQTEENIKLTQNYLRVLRGDVSLTGAKPKADETPNIDFNPEAEKKTEAAAKKMAEAVKKANEDIFKSSNAEMFAAIDAWVEADFSESEAKAKAQIKLIAEALIEERRQVFEFIDQQQEESIRKGQEAAGIFDGQSQKVKEVSDAARELGFTFSSAFEDAVIGGEKTRVVLQGLLQDVARIALRKSITEPLANKISGIDFGNVFSGLFGGGGGSSIPIDGYAGGGYTGGASRSGGLDGQGGFLAMLHPQETVVDHTMPMANSGGMQPLNINYVTHIDSRTDRREVAEMVERVNRNNNAQLLDQLQRQGRL